MNKKTRIWVSGLVSIAVLIGIGVLYWPDEQTRQNEKPDYELAEEGYKHKIEMKRARSEYFFNLLRDPATNEIPENIRSRELEYSKQLPRRSSFGFRGKAAGGGEDGATTQAVGDITWQSAGPTDLGGRTRALGVDQRDPDILIAGGVSGGIWKSIDGGNSWEMKTDPNQNMSVTSLAQDPGNPDTWYYSSGEFSGNSASDRGFTAFYHGTGIYRSIDNGENWSIIPSTEDTDNAFSSQYDYISRIKVSPSTGSIFVASNGIGVLRSTDGSNFSIVKGDFNHHNWTDFDIDSNGNIVAVFSSTYLGNTNPGNDPGIFYSTNDGSTWTDITPDDFPTGHDRSVIAFAPSDQNIVYVFTNKDGDDSNQGVSFFRIDISDPNNPVADDRSANLPDYGNPVGGVNTQGGYNMVVSVKPDDPNFVMVGGTNLFRSRDGFNTAPPDDNSDGISDADSKAEYWIGGYARINNVSQYSGQHPDQHVIVYDPNNPNRVWAGHDGGLSLTTDVTTAPVTWEDKDDGYVTGQFYTVAIPTAANDNRIIGGTQDNGTPFFRVNDNNQQSTSLIDVSSGDGSYAFWGTDYAYVSTQNGNVMRLTIESNGNLTNRYDSSTPTEWSEVYPSEASNQLFIHPYVIDPNDEGIMYYPGGTTMWRNTEVDQISNFNNGGTTEGWSSFEAVSTTGYVITTLEVTTVPADRLYYGASTGAGQTPMVPKIFRLDDATNSESPTDISIDDAESGAYVHDIAVNPNDGDEAIVVMSNYNIPGLYHTIDGGSNWTLIEGNLTGDSQNPGPSLRNATILPTSSGPVYIVGTSTGVYSTMPLDGNSTDWVRESDDGSPGSIGYSVAEFVTSRPANGTIAVGSHGRGIFLGSADISCTTDTTDSIPPASPLGLQTVSSNGGDIQLSWDLNNETDCVDKYRVYRGNDVNSLTLYDSTSSGAMNSFQDANTEFESYYYQITAVDVNGNESDSSNTAGVVRKYVTVNDQWKLVGMPLKNSDKATVPANTQVISFNGAYQVTESLFIKNGFWVKKNNADSIKFDGGAFTNTTLPLDAGWNLIGGIADTIAASGIEDPDNILSNTPIFEYSNNSYSDNVTEILPTTGYWIHADQGGDIELSVSDGSESSGKRPLADAGESFDKIKFRQGNRSQIFYLADGPVEKNTRDMFRMPPMAPNPTLDVRTSDGFRLAEGKSTKLKLTTSAYPVEVSLPGNSGSIYTLKAVAGRDTMYYDVSSGSDVVINRGYDEFLIENSASQLITEHELLPNYPNPFNPSTNIKYKIASESRVSLTVYDVLGRRVRILVNEVQEPGVYTKTFDAGNLSSGTYFIRIQADNFNSVRQMTLIK